MHALIEEPRDGQSPNLSGTRTALRKLNPQRFLPVGVGGGWGVSEVVEAFVTSLASVDHTAFFNSVLKSGAAYGRATSVFG